MGAEDNTSVDSTISVCQTCKFSSIGVTGNLLCSLKAKQVDSRDSCSYWDAKQPKKPRRTIVLGEYHKD